MAHRPRKELIETEIAATLERFQVYLTGTRRERRRKVRANMVRTYANRAGLFVRWAGTLELTAEAGAGLP